MAREPKTERNDRLLRAYLAGSSMDEVGASFAICKSMVRAILLRCEKHHGAKFIRSKQGEAR